MPKKQLKQLKTYRLEPEAIATLKSIAARMDRSQAYVLETLVRKFCSIKNLTP